MIGTILTWVFIILLWAATMFISFVAGMTKGFKSFLDKNKSNWDYLDKALYKQFTTKNVDTIDPGAELLAETKIADLNQRQRAEKVKKARKDILKKAAKEFKKERKNGKGTKKNK